MAKVDNIEIHPSDVDDLKRIFQDPVLHIYKTRKDNRDEYRLELSDRKTGIKAEIDTGNEAVYGYKADATPDFEDTWIGFKADGLDFDLNIFDLYVYGPVDKDGDIHGPYGRNCGLTQPPARSTKTAPPSRPRSYMSRCMSNTATRPGM